MVRKLPLNKSENKMFVVLEEIHVFWKNWEFEKLLTNYFREGG